FRFALVRLELPADLLTAGPPPRVDLTAVAPRPPALDGASNRPEPESPPPTIPATLVGHAPGIDPVSQLAAYWYEVDTTRPAGNPAVSWRPGLFVKADVAVPKAATRRAVTVAGTALLYHQGRVLAFVRVGPGRYERREVQVLGRQDGRWALGGGVEAGEPGVSRPAPVLLSEEFRGEADND